jgi:hypothetical protein
MQSSVYVVPALVFLALLTVWVLLRLLKGVSIIFDAFPLKVYFIGIVSVLGAFALVYFYFDYTQSTSMYLTFMYNVMANSK